MLTDDYGTCKYCGQVNMNLIYDTCNTAEERNTAATRQCKCDEAKREARIEEQIEKAQDRITQLFGSNAGELGFKPIPNANIIDSLNQSVIIIAREGVRAVTVQITSRCKAKISLTSKLTIKVERVETTKYQLEE